MASRHKSEFLASMSHELRTPLNAVLGFSEVLLERMFGEINERQEEYLRDIWSSGKHLLELLNEILDLSKVEAGQMELDYSTFDVRDLLEHSSSMLRERAIAHRLTLTVDIAPEVDLIEADELRFRQVVLNLLSNAVKFTPDGGSVRVHAYREGGDIAVTVTDSGVGVPEADQERIFESFQQGGRGAAREEGTGLGLTLSRRIVELLGGRMWLRSEVGVGSTFGFAIPARLSPDDDSDTATTTDANQIGAVVVIDDDRPSVELLSAYLSGVAARITKARDGPIGPGCRTPGAAGRGAARHPAAGHGRLGRAPGAEVGRRHGGHPGRHRVDPRRAREGCRARRSRVPRQAGGTRVAVVGPGRHRRDGPGVGGRREQREE